MPKIPQELTHVINKLWMNLKLTALDLDDQLKKLHLHDETLNNLKKIFLMQKDQIDSLNTTYDAVIQSALLFNIKCHAFPETLTKDLSTIKEFVNKIEEYSQSINALDYLENHDLFDFKKFNTAIEDVEKIDDSLKKINCDLQKRIDELNTIDNTEIAKIKFTYHLIATAKKIQENINTFTPALDNLMNGTRNGYFKQRTLWSVCKKRGCSKRTYAHFNFDGTKKTLKFIGNSTKFVIPAWF